MNPWYATKETYTNNRVKKTLDIKQVDQYIFVYGTLKRGQGNHDVLGGSDFIGEAYTVNQIYNMWDGGFPYVTDEGDSCIHGEVFRVTSQAILDRLDRLEGVPHLYVHHSTRVHLYHTPKRLDVLMYIASPSVKAHLHEVRKPVRGVDLSWPVDENAGVFAADRFEAEFDDGEFLR